MINKGENDNEVHKCCTLVNKAMSEISNCCHYFYPNFLHKLFLNVIEEWKISAKQIGTLGTKGDWDFRISDLVKNPDGTDI